MSEVHNRGKIPRSRQKIDAISKSDNVDKCEKEEEKGFLNLHCQKEHRHVDISKRDRIFVSSE